MVHQTAREFLLVQTDGAHPAKTPRSIPRPPEGKWHKSIVLKHAHHEVLDICLHYLSLLNVKSSRRLSIAENLFSDQFTGRFLEYAGRYWTVHYHCVAPDLKPAQLDMCARLCNSNTQGFGEWFNRASELAQNPGHSLREGVTQRDIAHLFGLEEVVQLLDRMLKPEDVQDPALKQAVASPVQRENGSIAIPNSPRLLAVEEVVHPHTISPGHLLESPLSEAVDTGFHLVGANHRRLSDWGDHSTRRHS